MILNRIDRSVVRSINRVVGSEVWAGHWNEGELVRRSVAGTDEMADTIIGASEG